MQQPLFLVRHGQASFFEDDYDELSELGRRQAERAADALSGRGVEILVSGTLKRQRQTAAVMMEVFHARGLRPSQAEDAAWNEFDPRLWLSKAIELCARDSGFARRFEEFRNARHARTREAALLFGGLTVDIVREWERNHHTAGDFRKFVTDILSAADELLRRNQTAVAVTSGTPIAVLMADRRGLAAIEACRFFQEIPNASITEIGPSRPGAVPVSPRSDHLDPAQMTLL